ncbi:MAG: nudF [Rhodospirillales bacterium]|jgi:ADP-ribose pyrophosphatase|nr:nudF [Rhodospirillales bacterium]
MDDAALEILACETAYRGFFRIDRYRLRQRHHDGWTPELTREVIVQPDAVGVLLYDPDRDTVVLIEQLRLPAHLAGFPARQIEIVAGLIDTDEDAAAVAIREVGEETGLALIGDLLPIRRFQTSPGGSTETVTVFCGRVDSRTAAGLHGLADEHEEIRVLAVSAAAALAMLESGAITNSLALLALYWLAANRTALQRDWPKIG